ncbi:gluconate 2-dehydrogenase subunit 3 family protein [Mesobaculum littorinae]|uniref:Gluconate 2-dehydrogenase subunit 3 family protein n=1 Tax=Mesobaculum littorinae TaxID=2486419 RepID=A0A438AKD3_9RHOB|nr:gluconate 2-dehydrogenase subunit 3 family protein [Mesobaculum littorinae]RVV99119.1 gluconate 2-dehydrogenase subunit 3 family protein [Mesobaculum littorinae]
MQRRQLLQMIAAATGTAFIAGKVQAYEPTETGQNLFSSEDGQLLNDLGETILPATDTPGARDADVGPFITQYVSDCYDDGEQALFRAGLDDLRDRVQVVYGTDFAGLSDSQRRAFVDDLDMTARIVASGAGEGAGAADLHWFTMMKQLVIFAFFTSQVGATEVLRYVAVPGRFDGDVDYNGEPAWAT